MLIVRSGNVYFRKEDFEDVDILPVEPVEWNQLYRRPDKDDAYAIGVDVAAGVGRDYSVSFMLLVKKHTTV
jgi:hypothetical protein